MHKDINNSLKTLSLIFLIGLTVSCSFQQKKGKLSLSDRERHFCDSLKLDTSIIAELRQVTASNVEPFHYSLGKSILKDGTEEEIDPINLQGLVFKETAQNTELILNKLHDGFKRKGYTIFTLDRNYGIGEKLDVMGVLKTTDKYEVLRNIKTDGINYDIDTDSLIKIIEIFDKKYSLDLVGAGGDWCEFIIRNEPGDWQTFAQEAYKVCPDIVEQGAETVEALADEMKKSKRLYFWWD